MKEEEYKYPSIPFEIESEMGDRVKSQTKELFKVLNEKIGELVWQVANDYIENYAETEPCRNFIDSVRQEVVRCSHIWVKDPACYWGQSIRKILFDEHKSEILPLIQTEQIVAMANEIGQLKEQIERLERWNRERY